MKLMTVLGARPQFVKAAMVSRRLAADSGVKETIVHTGQHYDRNMSELFFEEMMIPRPHHMLHVGSGSHAEMTGTIMMKLEPLCLTEKPDALMVYGDTNTTLAGALTASKLHIPVIHVESGLRSFNMRMPEEVNRIVTDRLSKLLLCPTQTAIENLKREGFENFQTRWVLTGDVMFDCARFYLQLANQRAFPIPELERKPFALCTIHRAENTDDLSRLRSILNALRSISEDIPVIIPLHPRTRKIITEAKIPTDPIRVMDPIGYFDMLQFLGKTAIVLTDSGGLQKEAYFCEKPCVVLRDQTEWVELLSTGSTALVGANQDLIVDSYRQLKSKQVELDPKIFGNGSAANIIVDAIKELK